MFHSTRIQAVCRRAYFCRSRDGSDLRVKVSALREVLHHHRAGVMQQGLLMNRVLHLWNLLQISHLEAFGLDTWTYQLQKQNHFCSFCVAIHAFLFDNNLSHKGGLVD